MNRPSLVAAGAFLAAAALLIAALFAIPPAWSHDHAGGDAGWIQNEPRFTGPNGEHCCGPQDCWRVPAGGVERLDDGTMRLTLADGRRVTVPGGFAWMYLSQTRGWWVCFTTIAGKVYLRCAFQPGGT